MRNGRGTKRVFLYWVVQAAGNVRKKEKKVREPRENTRKRPVFTGCRLAAAPAGGSAKRSKQFKNHQRNRGKRPFSILITEAGKFSFPRCHEVESLNVRGGTEEKRP